jgi:hypothetical protein
MGQRSTAIAVLTAAGLVGAVIGVASVGEPSTGVPIAAGIVRDVAVTTGIRRLRDPQPGDYWRGCNDARAAGTAPIYRDEPGYRPGMDGDGDGIACEPIPG